MNVYTIYKATCVYNGKVYIGFDSNWPHRYRQHKSKHTKQDYKFYRAIRKYGWDNFVWDIIYRSHDREHTLNVMEKHFIAEYDSFKNGYNSTSGGDGTFNHVLSEESLKKISIRASKPCKGPDGTIYTSAKQASIETSIAYHNIKYRCRKNILGWTYQINDNIPFKPDGRGRWRENFNPSNSSSA